ncbi:MAG: sulfite exporter TauE/SafE family protein [Solirubrobacterales bacterium]
MDPGVAELVTLGVWSFAVALAGGVAGLVLGNLRLPLVIVLASSPAAGAAANLLISGAAASAAAVTHLRSGRVDRRLFAWLAVPTLLGGFAGGLLAGSLPDRALVILIAVVVLLGAVEVGRRGRRGVAPAAGGPFRPRAALGVGAVVGALGGMVGLMLGSLRLPALVRWVGVRPAAAVGTNSAVGVLLGIGGLIGHLGSGGIDVELAVAGLIGAVPGAALGASFTGRLDEGPLMRAISAVLVVSAIALVVQAF